MSRRAFEPIWSFDPVRVGLLALLLACSAGSEPTSAPVTAPSDVPINVQITRGAYLLVLQRDGDAAGVAFWSARVQPVGALSGLDLLDTFAGSAEFRERHVAESDSDYGSFLYRQFLGREPA